MKAKTLKAKILDELGLPRDRTLRRAASRAGKRALKLGMAMPEVKRHLVDAAAEPTAWLDDPDWAEVARAANALTMQGEEAITIPEVDDGEIPEAPRAPIAIFAAEDFAPEPAALAQIEQAARLPVAVAAALMPDAHMGYGLPIGGVLATENAVIPYAVGMDIACRMRLAILDASPALLLKKDKKLADALRTGTIFGVGGKGKTLPDHPVLHQDWGVTAITRSLRERAAAQLGTSGSGNHFAEFGALTITDEAFELPPGEYLALLTHSGSRGVGGEVAKYYSRLAVGAHSRLPKSMRHLAWLPLGDRDGAGGAEGQAYWAAMELMGAYAAANHEVIHTRILEGMGLEPLAVVENHHNFAWKETHFGKEVIVHRKGATPAHAGVLGVIPGSMAAPGYVVRGKGEATSMHSAAHGAGRVMSRKAAKAKENWRHLQQVLKERGVTLLAGGLDESPGAYKDIGAVMRAQHDLVDIVGEFQPAIVMMAGD